MQTESKFVKTGNDNFKWVKIV